MEAHARGVRYFDVAPLYAAGASEFGLGAALRQIGDSQDIVLSTKVARFVATTPVGPTWWYDFSRDGTLRQLEESLDRLGRSRVDIVLIHDPNWHLAEAIDGTVRALDELRAQGVIGAIGVGAFNPEFLADFVERADLDCVLAADACSVLDARAYGRLAETCEQRGTSILAAGVMRRGLLGPTVRPGSREQATPDELRRLAALDEIARGFNVPITAIAIQFPLRHRAVSSVVLAASTLHQLTTTLDARDIHVPDACWAQVDELAGAGPG